MESKSRLEKILKLNVVDSTAGLIAGCPTYALFETLVLKYPNDYSCSNRALGIALSYTFLGLTYSRGRDLSHKLLRITNDSKSLTQNKMP
jgi:hypothetical protein